MKYTITHCEMWAAFEPAEGGYYYNCWSPTEFVTVKNVKDAKKYFNAMVKKYGYTKTCKTIAFDDVALNSKHYGEGCFISIKNGVIPNEKGKEVYC